MTQEDRERMAVAMREAEKALEEGEIPVGAALFRGDTLLWADHNRREQAHDPTAHAELLCMRHGAAEKGDKSLEHLLDIGGAPLQDITIHQQVDALFSDRGLILRQEFCPFAHQPLNRLAAGFRYYAFPLFLCEGGEFLLPCP